MKKIINLLLFLPFLLLISCGEEDIDKLPPQILEGNIHPQPATGVFCGTLENNVIFAQSGDSIIFGLTFRDEGELSQYKMEVHEAFDCHTHRGNTVDWVEKKVITITGTEYQVQEQLYIPTNVTAGNYHCYFSAIDAAGNTTEPVYYLLSIQNSADVIAPTITMTAPATSSVITHNGDTLRFEGVLNDNTVLSGGRLDLIYFSSFSSPLSAHVINLDTTVLGNNYNFVLEYAIPANLGHGSYDFEVKGFDAVGNAATKQEYRVRVQ